MGHLARERAVPVRHRNRADAGQANRVACQVFSVPIP